MSELQVQWADFECDCDATEEPHRHYRVLKDRQMWKRGYITKEMYDDQGREACEAVVTAE